MRRAVLTGVLKSRVYAIIITVLRRCRWWFDAISIRVAACGQTRSALEVTNPMIRAKLQLWRGLSKYDPTNWHCINDESWHLSINAIGPSTEQLTYWCILLRRYRTMSQVKLHINWSLGCSAVRRTIIILPRPLPVWGPWPWWDSGSPERQKTLPSS